MKLCFSSLSISLISPWESWECVKFSSLLLSAKIEMKALMCVIKSVSFVERAVEITAGYNPNRWKESQGQSKECLVCT